MYSAISEEIELWGKGARAPPVPRESCARVNLTSTASRRRPGAVTHGIRFGYPRRASAVESQNSVDGISEVSW
jgi:hypothetical protein